MTRSPRIVVAIATLSGCLILGVVIGALASPGGGADGDQSAASRPASPVTTTGPPTTTTALASTSAAPTTAPAASEPPATAAPTTTATPGPAADFGWSPETPRRGESIRLVDRSSGGPVSYTWRWSGSVIHSSRPGNVAFSVQRDTDVTLTVCDEAGRCAETTKTIVVS